MTITTITIAIAIATTTTTITATITITIETSITINKVINTITIITIMMMMMKTSNHQSHNLLLVVQKIIFIIFIKTITIKISIDRKENTAKTYKNNSNNIIIMMAIRNIIRIEETDMAMRIKTMTIIIDTIITNHHYIIMAVQKILTIITIDKEIITITPIVISTTIETVTTKQPQQLK